jgi:hypothetical protein
VVVDGKEHKEFDLVASRSGMGGTQEGIPQFSPDSKHVTYTAGGKDVVVVRDGIASGSYVGAGALTFSADSKHLAYIACRRNGRDLQYVVVRDSKPGKAYRTVLCDRPGDGLAFSSDGQHLAYAVVSRVSAKPGDVGYRLIVDGAESDEITDRPLGPIHFKNSTAAWTLAGALRIEMELTEK